jgi:hypothetical protein
VAGAAPAGQGCGRDAAHLFDASGAIVEPDTAAYLGKFMQAFAAWVAANRRT